MRCMLHCGVPCTILHFDVLLLLLCVLPRQKNNTVVPAGPSFTLSYWCFIPGV